MSTLEHYEKQRNANLFISNNANPFLISPYVPTHLSQATGNNILAADIIKPYTPNSKITVNGVMNFPGGVGGSQLQINGAPVFTNRIYLGGGLGGISWNILGSPMPSIVGTFGAEDQVVFRAGSALFTEPGGGYSLTVNGTTTTSNLAMNTTISGAAGASVGYIPITVNGSPFKIQIFNP